MTYLTNNCLIKTLRSHSAFQTNSTHHTAYPPWILNIGLKMNAWTFYSTICYACFYWSTTFADQTSSLFIRSVFENGISVKNVTSPTIRSCLANCGSTCSAVKYNPNTTECRMYMHVLMKSPIQAILDSGEMTYVKVSCFNHCFCLFNKPETQMFMSQTCLIVQLHTFTNR